MVFSAPGRIIVIGIVKRQRERSKPSSSTSFRHNHLSGVFSSLTGYRGAEHVMGLSDGKRAECVSEHSMWTCELKECRSSYHILDSAPDHKGSWQARPDRSILSGLSATNYQIGRQRVEVFKYVSGMTERQPALNLLQCRPNRLNRREWRKPPTSKEPWAGYWPGRTLCVRLLYVLQSSGTHAPH